MADYTELDPEIATSDRFLGVMKWPIMFILMITSLPAGTLPFITAAAYKGIGHEEHASPKWRNQRKIESGENVLHISLLVCAALWLAHAALVGLSLRRWDEGFLGVRGAVWFSLAWSVFALGMTIGIWLYLVDPD